MNTRAPIQERVDGLLRRAGYTDADVAATHHPARQGTAFRARSSDTATWVSELQGVTPADDVVLSAAAASG
jgi:hypothetical protein